jgi:ribosomal protein S18 acetylase RimI-like enzyme
MRLVVSEDDGRLVMPTIEIRRATPDDVEALAEAGRRLFTAAYGNISGAEDLAAHVDDYFSVAAVASEIESEDVQYHLAMYRDVIAGFLKIRRAAIPAQVPLESGLEVQQLYVAPDHQRKGVGRLLSDCAVAVAREENADGLWLSVWQEADWATSFYRAYGYRTVGTADFWLGKSHFTDFLMCLPLPAK